MGSESLFENYCRLVINSTELTDMMGNSLGTGLYLGLSALDHACSPNVNVVFSKNLAEVRAMTDIQSPVWSNVRLSYLNTVRPQRMRRARLKEDYYFNCRCELCETEDDGLCEGCVLCEKCRAPVGLHQEHCRACGAETNQNTILSETQIFFQIGESLLPAYRKYFSPHSASFGLHLAKLAKMAIYLDKNEEAVSYLKQACDVLKVSHGEHSEMMEYMLSVRATIP